MYISNKFQKETAEKTTSQKKISLLRYWTTRYFITLVIGLLVVAFLSVLWIRHTNLENRLNMTQYLVQEVADRFVEERSGNTVPQEGILEYMEQRKALLESEIDPIIYVVNADGRVIANPFERNPFTEEYFPLPLLRAEHDTHKLQLENGDQSYIVKTPIDAGGVTAGLVVAIQSAQELTEMNEEYRLLAILVVALALIGWATIYFLSKRLTRPIEQVASAAKHVKEENYDFTLPEHMREQEVYELVHSFKEMAGRLQQLELLRSEMMAGVTHELKTPITSMTGLIQAVRDDVVTGEEAKEFLNVSLNEANRLKTMVADLLEFNSFTARAVPMKTERREINVLLKEIMYQWEVANDEEHLHVSKELLPHSVYVEVDAIRVQQIVVNLMNNAKQALEGKGSIHVSLYLKKENTVEINVMDNGEGVAEEEKDLIFERFFRGGEKKYHTHGLGLGLPFSKMMARSMGGDLLLKESSPGRTIFTFQLPVYE
ncbi:HAMP domain-containing sensor histidine kinase [Alteribacillus iranensis]|uniref:HAMP domain-containing sensor histidine kinase n=1 Tax=Alteribacillus iranensis TaxID=930128 RepID=UPI000AC4DBDD|nr:HAMP domain-containing sensor histidine kinase [Alteribacillus iranensis]